MRSTNRLIGVMVGCWILLNSAQVFSQDWPQWRGPHRDGKVSGFTPPQAWPKALVQKWKTTVGSGDATPALVGDKLYVFARQGADEVILCLNAADGKQLWQSKYTAKAVKVEKTDGGYDAKVAWSNDQIAPQFNSPVLKSGLLFGMTGRGNLFCLNAETGKTAWTDATARSRGFCAMLDAGSVILALPDNAELIAFKPDARQYSELAKIKVSDTATYAIPVVAGKQIFVKDRDAVTLWSLD